jgi:hypothetical protein
LPASMMRSLSLRTRCAACSYRASACAAAVFAPDAAFAPVDFPPVDFAPVDFAPAEDLVLRARVLLDLDADARPDDAEVERFAVLPPVVRFAPEVDLEPPLLACGITPPGFVSCADTILPQCLSRFDSRHPMTLL